MEERNVRYPLIYSAVSAAMADIGAIGKDQKNLQQGWNFRGIDDIYNAVHPVLAKHNLFIAPEVLENSRSEFQGRNGTKLNSVVLKIKYTVYASDGSSVSATVIGEGMDSGDKASNKAMSIGMKYALFQIFCIPTEQMDDPDKTVPGEEYLCDICKKPITCLADENGKVKRTVQQVVDFTRKETHGKVICWDCYKKDPNKWKSSQE